MTDPTLDRALLRHLAHLARVRPRYRPHDELVVAALTALAERMAWAAARGDVAGWALARCWVEVVLFWAADDA
jgi:hypothetical protein